jgi:glycosyltransferase involved in cell wall biosynthesis
VCRVIRLAARIGETIAGAGQELVASLDFPLPETLAPGRGSAVFACGWCVSRGAPVRELAILLDGDVAPSSAHGMPRGDVLDALSPEAPPGSLMSGFWAVVPVSPREPGEELELLLRARLEDGSEAITSLGRMRIVEPPQPLALQPPEPSAGPFVAICMATYEPSAALFRRQLESLRAQTHRNWVCVVSDDSSAPEHFAEIEAELCDDPRFVVSRSPERIGFYRNFERAISLAPVEADYVALADQDDRWDEDKLETLLREVGDAQLVYSDARIVDDDGERIADTYWQERRNNHVDIASVLMANSVTGAASLFRREVLDYALPFPPGQFHHFHDHWLGLTALALGDVAFVERPLYDYVQHREAVLGHAEANRMPRLGDRFRGWRRPLRERVGLWRLTYFVDACRLLQFATILKLRCGERMGRSKRRALDRFMRADRSLLPLGWLAARSARELVGRPETLGAELGLFFGFAWRRALGATTRTGEPPRRLRLDARPPSKLALKPGSRGPEPPTLRIIHEKLAPLDVATRDDAPERVNLLIPTVDLEHFFGGYIGKLNLARRLAERGRRVRIVTVDPVGPLPPSWRRTVEAYSGLDGVFDSVEVVFGRESPGIEVSRADRFVATTWWTAHLARQALAGRDDERFLYLIQEYEPFTFAMGSLYALASESYTFPHHALFSTSLLRDWFRAHGLGVYADGAAAGDAASEAFQNAITDVQPPPVEQLARRRTRKLLFYARPEEHAARNMFELGALALSRALEEGVLRGGWELYGIGTVGSERTMQLGSGTALKLVPRRDQAGYAELLRDHDVGLALMYTPHPSLAPIEMAAAGMLTVTNTFETKTGDALAAISPNLIAVEPTIEGVVAGLRDAVAGAGDAERRVLGAGVNWSRDWNESFDDALMARLESFLRG